MKERLTVVKVGGKIVEEPDTLAALLKDFSRIEGFKILVHGGGRSATQVASSLGIETKMVDGRRITDDNMLKVVTMVYGGLINKTIVAGLQGHGVDALGMTGADMNIILSDKRPVKTVDYGWVGDVKQVNGTALATIIQAGVVPVIAPLTHDGNGHLLNTNADTMAGETAKGLVPYFDVHLVYCLEKAGVLMDETDDKSVIPRIDKTIYSSLLERGIVNSGMIPKLDNAFAAIDAGVSEVLITNASSLNNFSLGTHIC